MSHIALYRKKRPKTFSEIVGQSHIVRALCNQLTSEQVSHAYLFCGTRGTGKTSAAKILARAVNCQTPIHGEPCNICENCKNILAERSLDVAEIDAASNNGVENIRDLREEVKYPPTQGRYKVYIIDEVHMLSTSAFNALLKTLEEPPAHVIFILATTDPQKIPDTILSRCQRYDFRRISAAAMVATLKAYMQEEGVTFDDNALEYIAYHSDGAMRDALSLLDQCISLGGDGLTYDKVLEILGAVDRGRLFEFTDALAAKNSSAVMAVINQAMDDGRDVSQFAADLVRHFRDVLVATLADKTDDLEFSAEIAAKLKEQGSRVSGTQLMAFIHAFSEVLRELRFAPHMRTAFEVCALKLCMHLKPEVLFSRSENADMPKETPVAASTASTHSENAVSEDLPQINPPAKEAPSHAAPQSSSTSKSETASIETLKTIASAFHTIPLPMPLRSWCARAGAEVHDGVLQIICDNEASSALIKKQQGKIREAIADKFNLNTPPNLAFVVRTTYNKGETVDEWKQNPPPAAEEPVQAPPGDWADFGTPVEAAPKQQAQNNDDWASFGQPMLDGDGW